MKLVLEGISGDCQEAILKFDSGQDTKILFYVREFLDAQHDQTMCVYLDDAHNMGHIYSPENTRLGHAVERLNQAGNKLIELGLFEHKWHKRTTWQLREEFEND